jgi:hypothetical protein
MFAVVVLGALQFEPRLPPVDLSDREMLPGIDRTYKTVHEAREHLRFCREQRAMRLSPQLPWDRWVREAERTAAAWEWLMEATSYSWFGDEYKLQCLSELRDLIGWNAYYAGVLPEPPR